MNSVLRGLVISFFSAITITFMVTFFSPMLPFKILEGETGILVFLAITAISYFVYVLLPPETTSTEQIPVNLGIDSSEKQEPWG